MQTSTEILLLEVVQKFHSSTIAAQKTKKFQVLRPLYSILHLRVCEALYAISFIAFDAVLCVLQCVVVVYRLLMFIQLSSLGCVNQIVMCI